VNGESRVSEEPIRVSGPYTSASGGQALELERRESASGERESRVSEERISGPHASTSGGQAPSLELEQRKKKRFAWLRNLKPKFHRR
jgi:hypothetical protein